MYWLICTEQKVVPCSRLIETELNNVVLLTLFIVVNNIVQLESGVAMSNNIFNNCQQCGQQNIVQSYFYHN